MNLIAALIESYQDINSDVARVRAVGNEKSGESKGCCVMCSESSI